MVKICGVMVSQVSFTPNGMDMRMLQPCDAPLRRHFLPGVKVEYSVSPRQRAYRVQIHRIQVKRSAAWKRNLVGLKLFFTSAKIYLIIACLTVLPVNPELPSWMHLVFFAPLYP